MSIWLTNRNHNNSDDNYDENKDNANEKEKDCNTTNIPRR